MHKPDLLPVTKDGFPPLVGAEPVLLVLGTLPGDESIRRGQYYGHPRNAFWPVMGELFAFDWRLPYPERVTALTAAGVAVWDVLARAVRPGSLDAAISEGVPNPVGDLIAAHPSIRRVACNGGGAMALFRRHFPQLAHLALQLPSTSPAAARWNFKEKLDIWRQTLNL